MSGRAPVHSHRNPLWCTPTCLRWKWEALQEKRSFYYSLNELEELLEERLRVCGDEEGLAILRRYQREHPNLWPRA